MRREPASSGQSPGMLEIWWIRHALTPWNQEHRWQGHTDIPLSPAGREQALRLGQRLSGVPFDQVWCSDLSRTRETAALALPGIEPREDPRLRELGLGVMEGRTLLETPPALQAEVHAWWTAPYSRPFPGGTESFEEVTARVEAWRGELPSEGRIAVFTHGGVIRACLWRVTGPPQGGSWRVQLDNTSLTRISYAPQQALVLGVNDTAHLEPAWPVRAPGDA